MRKCVICNKEYEGRLRSEVCSLYCASRRSAFNRKNKISIVKNCIVCGGEFIASRVDKQCCSKNCASRNHYYVKTGKTNHKKLKTCTNCGNEKPLSSFYNIRKTYFAFCKSCYNIHNADKFLIAKLKVNNFIDVENYVNKIKRQKYMASDIDVFSLIDLFDVVFPDDLTTYPNPLDTLNYYFYKLAFWYKDNKEKIYKSL